MLYLVGLTVMSACSEQPQSRVGEPTPEDRQRFSRGSVPRASAPAISARVAAESTGDPDRDFLRRMSDHHKGVIHIVHSAIESNRDPALHATIRKVEESHDHALDGMLALLRSEYGDAYLPQTSQESDRIADLVRKSSNDHTKLLLAAADKAEADGLRIVNDYLPRAKSQRVHRLAENLKRGGNIGMAPLRRTLNVPQRSENPAQ